MAAVVDVTTVASFHDASHKENLSNSGKHSEANGGLIADQPNASAVENGQLQDNTAVGQAVHSIDSPSGSPGKVVAGFPKYQSPTITLLQKKRDGTLSKGAVYMLGLLSYDEMMNKKNRSVLECDDDAIDGQSTVIRRPSNKTTAQTTTEKKETTKDLQLESKQARSEASNTITVSSPVASRLEQFESNNVVGNKSVSSTTKTATNPRRIEDYEPGNSSVTPAGTGIESRFYNPPISKPGEHSQYMDSSNGLEYNIRKLGPMSPTLSDAAVHKVYRNIQKGGSIPHSGLHSAATETSRSAGNTVLSGQLQRLRNESIMTPLSIGIPDSSSSPKTRQQRDLENAMRRLRLDRMVAEEKRKRFVEQQRDTLSRRHSDFYTPFQRAPVLLNRYDEDDDGGGGYNSTSSYSGGIRRPTIHPNSGLSRVRGKARALYTFRAQSGRELSFRKGDYLYLLRQVNENWFLGERHGMRGIFPVTYVEVIVSLSDAHELAAEKEGLARALYNFDAQTFIELSLKKGDLVKLVRAVDENWYEGHKDGGRRGIFPVSYVETLVEPDLSQMTPMTSRTVTPGPLSPCGSVVSYSHSIAPTIPSAPLSPADSESFDESQFLDSSRNSTRLDVTSDLLSLNSRPTTLPTATTNAPLVEKSLNLTSSSALTATANSFASEVKHLTQSYQWLDKYLDPENWKSAESSNQSVKGAGGKFVGSATWSPQVATVQPAFGETRPLSMMSKTPSSYSYTQLRYPPYRVQYSYQPRNVDELELRVGDVVYVVEMCDDGWYVGTCERTQDFGTFPGNFVQKMR